MFTFVTKSTIARETEKAWGIDAKNGTGIYWLPKSQCTVKVMARPNEEEIIRGEITFKCIKEFGELNEDLIDLIETAVAHEMSKFSLEITAPDWLARKNDLVYAFTDNLAR